MFFLSSVLILNGANGNVTCSQTHDGFDNDATTMNHVLRTVLGKALPEPIKPEKLRY